MVMHQLRRVCLALALAVPLAVLIARPVVAQEVQEATASGEVRRVDIARERITIKHGAISDLELPAMTLVYHAQASLLEGLRAGDKVRFTAKRENDRYVVTEISK